MSWKETTVATKDSFSYGHFALKEKVIEAMPISLIPDKIIALFNEVSKVVSVLSNHRPQKK